MIVVCEGYVKIPLLVAVAVLYTVMLDLCEDRPSCAVRASPETFTQDPCEDTSKYLEAHYKCRPNQFERQTVCQGEEMELVCGKGDRIAIYSAMFGRTPNGTELCPPHKQGYIDCQASGTVSEVRTRCHGRKNCAMLANESVFGDPCAAGINKYLTVSYACVPRKILKQLHRKSNRRKKKKKKKRKKKKGKKNVTKLTNQTESSEAPPTQSSSHDPIDQSASPDVYETFEQSSVTQILPDITTDSTSNENDQHQSSVEDVDILHDVTTFQEDANIPDDAVTREPALNPRFDPKTNTGRGSNKATDNTNSGDIDVSSSSPFGDDRRNSIGEMTTDGQGTKRKPSRPFGGQNNNNIKYKDKGKTGQVYPDSGSNIDNVGRVRENNPGAIPTDSPSMDTTMDSASSQNGRDSNNDPKQGSNSNNAKGSKDSDPPFVTERNLTVLCINYTRPDVKWRGVQRPRDERSIGFIKDWFSVIHYLKTYEEKAWLYFTLGICFGIIVMLIVVLVKVCFNFRRNIRARLDVSEPTHRSAHINNHSSLDAPMLEHSDSIDRIEVVRFSPRSTLRSLRNNSHNRDLVNYYG